MADVGDGVLESLINQATNPALPDEDWEHIMKFCDQINKELEGPQISVRLIAHKIQSPQEKEALYALTCVESCVKNCGRRFHQEIGKFRFLNEMIKVVSPKYLGEKTTAKVKQRCIELIYSWSKGLSHESKIAEAYQMLKAQGIVKEDPTYVDKTLEPPPPARTKDTLFEDEEKSKLLARLLKSKHPEDLQAANRLIKNMVKQDADRMEKAARRINELETINNNVKVLGDMLDLYDANVSSSSDTDMMKELYETLEKRRPNLFRFASDADEKDGALTEILKANDNVMKVMGQYKRVVEGQTDEDSKKAGDALLDLSFDPSSPRKTDQSGANTGDASSAILTEQLSAMGLQAAGTATALPPVDSQANTLNELSDIFGGLASQAPAPVMTNNMLSGGMASMPATGYSTSSQSAFAAGVFSQSGPAPATHSVFSDPGSSGSSGAAATPQKKAMQDLDILGQTLLHQNLPKEPPIIPSPAPQKLSLNQIQAKSQPAAQQQLPWGTSAGILGQPAAIPTIGQNSTPNVTATINATFPASPALTHMPNLVMGSPVHMGSTSSPVPQDLSLADIFVALESVQPSEVPSLNAYDKNGIKIVIHFGQDRPRPGVSVMVVSIMSTNSSPVNSLIFQAAVPKVMKVKLQPPSATDLPAYNPILPPSAITQVMLLANPQKERVRLKFKLTYSMNNQSSSDVGDVDNFPVL